MKLTTDAALICLIAWFVLSFISIFARSIVTDSVFIDKEEFDQFNVFVKLELHFLVTGRIVLIAFIFFQLRKVFRNLTCLHPFERENI